VGAELKDGLREGPSWIAFARENGTVYHTYTVMAPDPFVAPYYSLLLERTPKGRDDSAPPHLAQGRVPGLTAAMGQDPLRHHGLDGYAAAPAAAGVGHREEPKETLDRRLVAPDSHLPSAVRFSEEPASPEKQKAPAVAGLSRNGRRWFRTSYLSRMNTSRA
jgi:hypothetical protein